MPSWFPLALVIGTLFASWPFFLRRSGLEIGMASTLFSFWSFLVIAAVNFCFGTISLASFQKITPSSFGWACVSATAGGIGVVLFNHAFSSVKMQEVGQVSSVVTLIQVIATFLIYLIVNACGSESSVTQKQLFGFGFALVAIYLLCFK